MRVEGGVLPALGQGEAESSAHVGENGGVGAANLWDEGKNHVELKSVEVARGEAREQWCCEMAESASTTNQAVLLDHCNMADVILV